MATTVKKAFEIELNSQFKDHVEGFNGSLKPLGDRDDLHILLDDAINSGSPRLLKLFKTIPTEQEWLDYKGSIFMKLNPED